MEKLKFNQEEVIGFLEDLIVSGEATQDEIELYEDSLWNGQIHKMNATYKKLVITMREWFEITY